MEDHPNDLVVASVTRSEAKVWRHGIESGSDVLVIHAQHKAPNRHVRAAQHHHGHDPDHSDPEFYEQVAAELAGAAMVVLVGHGKGKASAMEALVRYLERKHPALGHAVVGTLDANLEALSNDQTLALAREWYVEHREFI